MTSISKLNSFGGSKVALTLPNQLICPSCGTVIALSEALLSQVQSIAEDSISDQLAGAHAKLETEFQKRLVALEKERELKMRAERLHAEDDAKRREGEYESELSTLRTRLKEAERNELTLRGKQANIEAREQAFDLELQRRLDLMKADMAKDIQQVEQVKAATEIQRREFEIQRLHNKIAELSRPNISGEILGESLEVSLRDALRQACPLDEISDVPRGQTGADLNHSVRNSTLQNCGSICWEIKNTRNWDRNWLAKTKIAQRETNADIAVIVTATLPEDIKYIGLREGVWITTPAVAVGLAGLLRHMVLRLMEIRVGSRTRDTRLQALNDYINSARFRLAAESVIGTVRQLEEQLESERKTMTRAWAKRQQYLLSLGGQIADVVGSLEGSVGKELTGEIVPLIDEVNEAARGGSGC